MRLVRFLLRSSPPLLLLACVTSVLSGATGTLILAVINACLHGAPETLGWWASGWIFVTLCVLQPALRILSHHLLARLVGQAVRDLRRALVERILTTPLPALQRLGTHRLMATLSDDIQSVSAAVGLMPQNLTNGALTLGCLCYLAWLDPRPLLALAVALVLGVAVYSPLRQRGTQTQRQLRAERDTLYEQFRAIVDGTKELQLHRPRRRAFLADQARTEERLLGLWVGARTLFGAAASFGFTFFFLFVGALVFGWIGPLDPDPAQLTGYVLALLFVMSPLQVVLNTVPQLAQAGVALDKVEALGLALDPSADTDGDIAPLPATWHRLALEGTVFKHSAEGDQEFRVGPIDLELRPAEIVFLTGGNGSGKTTLALILAGLYTPQEGSMRLDEEEIASPEDRERYRQMISAVFWDSYVFEKLLGLEHPELDAEARRYLERLELAEKVEVRDAAFSAVRLSRGQRKRLALVTAYLEDRPIYIFDEWAAEQDPVFRDLFYHHLLPELRARGKAVLVISHDDRYFDLADRLIKLDQGRIVEV